jgi:hypothetical protein
MFPMPINQEILLQVRQHWSRYLHHEEDFASFVRLVPLLQKNSQVSSDQLVRLGLKTGSMVETCFKRMARQTGFPLPATPKITDYVDAFEGRYGLSSQRVRVKVDDFGIVSPFQTFQNKESPLWWKIYSSQKHDYDEMFANMTLEQCTHAMAGLFLLNVYPIECREYLADIGVIYDSGGNRALGLFSTLLSDDKVLRGDHLRFVQSICAETTCFRFEFARLQFANEDYLRYSDL